MATDVCGECGRPHQGDPTVELPVLDVDGRPLFDAADHQPPDRDRSALIGGAIAVAALVFGIWALGIHGGDLRDSGLSDGRGDGGEPDPASGDRSGDPDRTGADTESSDGGLGLADGDGPAADSGVIASSLLAALDSDALVSFLGGRAVTTIDLRSGEVTTAELGTDQVFDLDDFVLLSDGTKAVGIVSDDPSEVVSLGSTGEVVVTDEEKTYTIVNQVDGGVDLYTGRVLEGFVRVFRPPTGSAVLSVQGLGVLVTPPTGGTYLATVRGFELFRPGRVVAASEAALLEQICDEALRCSVLLVDRSSGTEEVVDPSVLTGADEVFLSPDGRWILSVGAEGSRLHQTATGASTDLSVEARGTPQWAPDSAFLTWFDTGGEVPVLEFAVVDSDAGATFRVGLSSLHPDLLSDDAFVVHG